MPRCDLTDIRKEVNELRDECGDCEPLAYSTVWEAWSKHPMLTHVRMHRDKRNKKILPHSSALALSTSVGSMVGMSSPQVLFMGPCPRRSLRIWFGPK